MTLLLNLFILIEFKGETNEDRTHFDNKIFTVGGKSSIVNITRYYNDYLLNVCRNIFFALKASTLYKCSVELVE